VRYTDASPYYGDLLEQKISSSFSGIIKTTPIGQLTAENVRAGCAKRHWRNIEMHSIFCFILCLRDTITIQRLRSSDHKRWMVMVSSFFHSSGPPLPWFRRAYRSL